MFLGAGEAGLGGDDGRQDRPEDRACERNGALSQGCLVMEAAIDRRDMTLQVRAQFGRTLERNAACLGGAACFLRIVIYWNTVRLGQAFAQRRRAGLPVPAALLAPISPLGWAHILLTGQYRWRERP